MRISIARILSRFSERGRWDNDENYTFYRLESQLQTFWGRDKLEAFDATGKRIPVDSIEEVIRNGYPSEVLDIVEGWFAEEPPEARECERELNDLLAMNSSPWRIVNGQALLIHSEYLHEEVQAKAIHLLREGGAFGALEEFHAAVQDLQIGESKDAIVKAHKSVESVMKRALAVDGHLTFGGLLSKLIDSKLIPEYYQDFLRHFEKLALGAVKERNLPGRGHGQGINTTEVSQSLAEFAVNLAGTINLFIIQRWIETRQKEPPHEAGDDYIPF